MRDRRMEPESKNHVLFTQGEWEIHAEFEDSEWAEAFHHCKKWNVMEDKVQYSYQIPGDTNCPGCNKIQPDEIQGMVAMYNMDKPTRQWGKSVMEQIRENHNRIEQQIMYERNMDILKDRVK